MKGMKHKNEFLVFTRACILKVKALYLCKCYNSKTLYLNHVLQETVIEKVIMIKKDTSWRTGITGGLLC